MVNHYELNESLCVLDVFSVIVMSTVSGSEKDGVQHKGHLASPHLNPERGTHLKIPSLEQQFNLQIDDWGDTCKFFFNSCFSLFYTKYYKIQKIN